MSNTSISLARDYSQKSLRYNDHMKRKKVGIPKDKIKKFCQEHHIRSLAFFGSFIREDFRADSDIDVLVEFEPYYIPGFDFFLLEEELSLLLGKKVDLQTPAFLSPVIRQSVITEAIKVYDKQA